MEKEERAFRRLVTEAVVSGSQEISSREINAVLGIGHNLVAKARKTVKEREERLEGVMWGRVSVALARRKRKTATTLDRIRQVKVFYEEKSTPTANTRDVKRYWV